MQLSLAPHLCAKSKAEEGAGREKKSMFSCGSRNEINDLVRSGNQKVVRICPEAVERMVVPAGLRDPGRGGGVCVGPLHVLSPHHRTHTHRAQRSSKASTVLQPAGLRYTPINDASFMKKEQPNGNLCCIEPAKENTCQVSGLLSLASWILFTLRIGHRNGKSTEDPGQAELSTALHVSSTLCRFMTPTSPRNDTDSKLNEAGLSPVPR